MANKDLEFVLRFKNEARQVLQQARQDLKGLGQEAAIVGTQLRQMSGAGAAINTAMVQTATGAQKAEIAQKRLEIQQARLEIQSQKLVQQQAGITLGEQRLALQTERLTLAKKKLENAQKTLGDRTSRNDAIFNRLTGTLYSVGAALASALGLVGLAKTSDQFTNLSTSIRNVTDTAEEYTKVYDDLYEVSQKYGNSFPETVAGYRQLNISVADSIKKSFDLVEVTELISRGFAASDASVQTASGALLQLTQGLATDFKAAGQELTSIIEGAPLLSKAIAEQLGGKSAADLKIFAEQGKLTSAVFIQALLNAREAIEKFEIPNSIEKSIVRVKNAFLDFVGKDTTIQQAANVIAAAFNYIAENMGTFIRIIEVLAFTAIPALVVVIGSSLVRAFAALRIAVLANPLTLIATGIAFATAAIYTFRKELFKLAKDIQEVVVNKAKKAFAIFTDTIVATFSGALAAVKGLVYAIEIEIFKLSDSLASTAIGKKLGITTYDLGSDFLTKIRLAGKSAGENFQDAFLEVSENGRYAKILLDELNAKNKKEDTSKTKEEKRKSSVKPINLTGEMPKEQVRFYEELARDIELLKEETKWVGKSSEARERATAILKLQQEAIKAGIKDFDPSEYIAAYDALHAAQEKVHTDFMTGWRAAMQDFAENAKGLGDLAQDIFKQASDGISDTISGLVDGTVNSFASLRESVSGILKDLAGTIARFVIQQQILMPLLGAFGFGGTFGGGATTLGSGEIINWFPSAKGNAFTQGIPVKYFASGGVLNGPTAFPMRNGTAIGGEAGAEGLLPLKRLSNGDLGVQSDGSGTSNTTQLNYSPVFSISMEGSGGGADKQAATQLSKILDDEGKKMVLRVIAEQQRPGGILAGGRGKTA